MWFWAKQFLTKLTLSMISEIFQSARWNWHPTTTGAVWAVIIAVFHRISAHVCSLSSCQLLYPLSLFKSLPSIHVTVSCELSSTDLVSVCRDWVSRWAKVEPPSRASRKRGGVWAGVLRRGGVGLEGLYVVVKMGRLALRSGGGLRMGRGWYSVNPPWDKSWCWFPSLTLDWPWRENKQIN